MSFGGMHLRINACWLHARFPCIQNRLRTGLLLAASIFGSPSPPWLLQGAIQAWTPKDVCGAISMTRVPVERGIKYCVTFPQSAFQLSVCLSCPMGHAMHRSFVPDGACALLPNFGASIVSSGPRSAGCACLFPAYWKHRPSFH
ncbi:hypothetical protein DL89DRAFT_263752 [Linderina pennispora]|uniref:Uncharacterized protein n=1 Tax=Linderina pennispora TaxID=61395 RepID=A0A1Y1WKK6_9FUNG|nr:uncharacterized protein DL89DRAFT_263752 [Linderina pennispora]ORX73736.1 hypothetical protein DL89DRAFT_263752 [Linderina pennispora]